MSSISHPVPGGQQCVTASDLVRHFGVWQERAARAPVYILHRGRPRLVLTSLDVMDALCGPHAGSAQPRDDTAAALLDADDRAVIVFDPAGNVRHASRGARQRFGEQVRSGEPALHLASSAGDLLIDAIRRVGASGLAETVEFATQRYPDRRAQCRIAPFPGGSIATIDDLTGVEESRALRQLHAATLAAATEAGTIVTLVGPRGYLLDPPAALADRSGIARETLAAARFVSLFDVGDRVAIGEALERVLRDRDRTRLSATLLVRGAASSPVSLGLAPVVEHHQVVAAMAAIVALPPRA